jgi:DNA-binding transcriptional regulator YiaG
LATEEVRMIELDILAAEALGRQTVAHGSVQKYRQSFTLSRNRLAYILGTGSFVVGQWEDDPKRANTMHSMSAAKLGQLISQLDEQLKKLGDQGVDPEDLMPLGDLANMLGRSSSSPFIAQMCHTGKLTCFNLGVLGTYVPKAQVDALRGK